VSVGSLPPGLVASVYGNGITACTAGVAASFTLVARDVYSNIRDSEESDTESWLAVAFSDPGQAVASLVVPTLTWSAAIPGYSAVYTPNFAGTLSVQVSRSVVGGLIATYYPNLLLQNPSRVSFEPAVTYTSVNNDAEASSELGTIWPGT
jgi:hypothetical protein